MKTTINLSDQLLQELKQLAAEKKTTMTAIIETALQGVLAQTRSQSRPFQLKKCTFKGRGLCDDALDASQWHKKIYERQGS